MFQLLRPQKMLRSDLLKFGDVILCSGFEPKDIVVILATRKGLAQRRYSHAAFVFTPSIWLESTGEGTGLTYLSEIEFWRTNELRRVIDVSHYRRIDVFRMVEADLSGIDPSAEEFQEILKRFVGLQYPSLSALADTTNWLRKTPQLKRSIMAKFNSEEVVNPGAFCSQLIVELFDECKREGLVKLGIMNVNVPSLGISPNDLADSSISRLVRLEGLVTCGKVSEDERPLIDKIVTSDFDRNAFVESGNRLRAGLVTSKTTEKLAENVKNIMQAHVATFSATNAAMLKELGMQLLVSKESPVIEDLDDRPELREIQEQALESGLNPAWLRLEGLASSFVWHTDKCSDFVWSCAKAMESFFIGLNSIPTSKHARTIRQNAEWLGSVPGVLETYKLSIDHLRVSQEFYLRGFPSDTVWINFMKERALSFMKEFLAFIELLDQLGNALKTARLKFFANLAAKTYSKHIQRVKNAVEEIVESVRLLGQTMASPPSGGEQKANPQD